MKEFLEYLVKSIVRQPDQVKIEQTREEDQEIYNITVAKEDMGIVIGKEGRTIKSLREMAKCKAIRDNIRIRVVLLDQQDEQI